MFSASPPPRSAAGMRSLAAIAATLLLVVNLAPAAFGANAKKGPVLEVLHIFIGDGLDGAYPIDNGSLARDTSGNVYGTTFKGGAYGFGCVFKLVPKAHMSILYSFGGGSDGANPFAGVTVDARGNVYGTTQNGGAYGFGTVFKVNQSGQETLLYSFSGGTDGGTPYATVISDNSGNLYGTTFQGGAYGFGTVFTVSSSGEESVLHSFANGRDGAYPNAGLIFDSQGNLYGTTTDGGPNGFGTVFSITTTGTETILYSFTGGADGGGPFSGVVRDAKGNLYGTTLEGGAKNIGTVYKLSAANKETVIYSFTTAINPYAGVVFDKDGNLYGTTLGAYESDGVAYRVTKSGHETDLHTFVGRSGVLPYAGLIPDQYGDLYGVTYGGGYEYNEGQGVLFKLIPYGK